LRLSHRVHEQASRALVVDIKVDDERAKAREAELTSDVQRDSCLADSALTTADREDFQSLRRHVGVDSGKAWRVSPGLARPAFLTTVRCQF